MAIMGNKLSARTAAQASGAPIVPGTTEPVEDLAQAKRVAANIGYPIMLKAASGGGGKGMRTVRDDRELESAFELTRGEAAGAFGDATVYLERFIERPRHIEVQVFGDEAGNLVHLGERECTIQRRHQKVIEEAPSVVITPEQRAAMGEAALKVARQVKYRGAGTVEFIYAPNGEFYFLEMNTRLQVEHPVTELVYGVDLVHEQLRVAQGEILSWKQEDLVPNGWAFECRIYAEDPFNNFLPSLGRINRLRLPSGPGIRNDVGMYQGLEVPRFYDPMLGKLISHGRDREEARRRMLRALREYMVEGIRTNIAFHRWIINSEEFIHGEFDTGFIERNFTGKQLAAHPDSERAAIIAAVIATHEEAQRMRPSRESGGAGVNAWKLMGRPGALGRGR
jgi:acetyl/propionyl-CoA carboxylase alpha subunit